MESEGIKNGENQGGSGNSGFKRKPVIILIGLLVIAFLVWFMGSGGNDKATAPNGIPVVADVAPQAKDHVSGDIDNIDYLGLVEDEYVGNYFVHPESRTTLYTSENDCTGDCLTTWTPYTGSEWSDGDLQTITRDDTGETQYTWLRMALYTFNNDVNTGDFLGDGFTEGFMVARP